MEQILISAVPGEECPGPAHRERMLGQQLLWHRAFPEVTRPHRSSWQGTLCILRASESSQAQKSCSVQERQETTAELWRCFSLNFEHCQTLVTLISQTMNGGRRELERAQKISHLSVNPCMKQQHATPVSFSVMSALCGPCQAWEGRSWELSQPPSPRIIQ